MSRLIDADELLKELESNKLQPTKDTDGFIDGWCEGFNTVVDMIRNQPTAFDTEKVVAELEKATQYVDLSNPSSPIRHEVKAIHPIVAIEIVRKGGVL